MIASEPNQIDARADGRAIAKCNSATPGVAGYLARLVAKQQTTALAATVVDYLVMAACVSGAGLGPSLGTALGALAGTVVGFALARRWVFRASDGPRLAQASRYVAVSLVSLVANTAGEECLVRAGLQYVAARTIVSVVVGLAWNLPMQQLFVFGRRARG